MQRNPYKQLSAKLDSEGKARLKIDQNQYRNIHTHANATQYRAQIIAVIF